MRARTSQVRVCFCGRVRLAWLSVAVCAVSVCRDCCLPMAAHAQQPVATATWSPSAGLRAPLCVRASHTRTHTNTKTHAYKNVLTHACRWAVCDEVRHVHGLAGSHGCNKYGDEPPVAQLTVWDGTTHYLCVTTTTTTRTPVVCVELASVLALALVAGLMSLTLHGLRLGFQSWPVHVHHWDAGRPQ